MKLADLTYEAAQQATEQELHHVDFLCHRLFATFGKVKQFRETIEDRHCLVALVLGEKHRTPLQQTKDRGEEFCASIEGKLPGWIWVPGFAAISGSCVYLEEEEGRRPRDMELIMRSDFDRESRRFRLAVDDGFALKLVRSLENARGRNLNVRWIGAEDYQPGPTVAIFDLFMGPVRDLRVTWLDEPEFAKLMYKEDDTERLLSRLGDQELDLLLRKLKEMNQEGVL